MNSDKNRNNNLPNNDDFIIYEFENKPVKKDSGLDNYYDHDEEFEYLNYEISLKDYLYITLDKLKYLLKNKTILLLLFCISLIVYFVCVFYLSRYFIYEKRTKNISENIIQKAVIEEPLNTIPEDENNIENSTQNENSTTEINNEDPFDINSDSNYINKPFLNIDFKTLTAINPDTVGWIKVDNTNINYPVVKSRNNSYYLNHSFDKTINKNGWIFMDYRNNPVDFGHNTIIYGHNMRTETMFSTLKNVKNPSWYSNTSNLTIRYNTTSASTIWQIFSIYTIDKETFYLTTEFYDDNSIQTFYNTLIGRSIHNFNVKLTTSDKILTLSTCDQSSSSKRLVVHARLVDVNRY